MWHSHPASVSLLLTLVMASCVSTKRRQGAVVVPPAEEAPPESRPTTAETPTDKTPEDPNKAYKDYIKARQAALDSYLVKWRVEKPGPVFVRQNSWFMNHDHDLEVLNLREGARLDIFYDISFDAPATCQENYFSSGPHLFSSSLKDGLHGKASFQLPTAVKTCTMNLKARGQVLGSSRKVDENRIVEIQFLREQQILWAADLKETIVTIRDAEFKLTASLQNIAEPIYEPTTRFSLKSDNCPDLMSSLTIVPATGVITGRSLKAGNCELMVVATPTDAPQEAIEHTFKIEILDKPEKPVLINFNRPEVRNFLAYPLADVNLELVSYDGNGDPTTLKVKATTCPFRMGMLPMRPSETYPFAQETHVSGCVWNMKKDEVCTVDLIAATTTEESEPYRLQIKAASDVIKPFDELTLSEKTCLLRIVN